MKILDCFIIIENRENHGSAYTVIYQKK